MKTMKGVDPEEVFPQVEKMLYNLAWKTAMAHPIDFEEARSEAFLAFMKACWDYDPRRGQKFSTWCYYWAWCKLKDIVIARSSSQVVMVELNEEVAGEAPPERSPTLELIDELSDDAKEIIALVLETPKEILRELKSDREVRTTRQLIKAIRQHLISRGWKATDFDRAHKEIRKVFQAAWA